MVCFENVEIVLYCIYHANKINVEYHVLLKPSNNVHGFCLSRELQTSISFSFFSISFYNHL